MILAKNNFGNIFLYDILNKSPTEIAIPIYIIGSANGIVEPKVPIVPNKARPDVISNIIKNGIVFVITS
jgi:hypothetical protein